MYQIEVQHIPLTSDVLPSAILKCFVEIRTITHLCLINWDEHCTECAWPSCYSTCDLYNRRNDGHCRRTIDGFSPVEDAVIFGDNVVRVRFKQWCNLFATCHISLRKVADIKRIQRRLNTLSKIAASMPNLGRRIGRPGLLSRVVRHLKKCSVVAKRGVKEVVADPNCFLLEVYNPQSHSIDLSLDIAAYAQGLNRIPFKRLLKIEPGFQRVQIPFADIKPRLAGAREVTLTINPNILSAEEEGLTLFFGLMTFVYDPSYQGADVTASSPPKVSVASSTAAKKIKVAIWDLDNTVWTGTLIEDGPGNVMLRPGVGDVIESLDARGIINSIASKNHKDAALAELQRLGLRDYFVFPRVGWGPKSEAVRNIIRSFNVGEDTIAFIDDQPFEREEVRASNPKVRVYTHEQVATLLSLEEFDVPVTEEARNRRLFYLTEEARQQAMKEVSGDYLSFLKQSKIRVHIAAASADKIDRIHELVQRTNQMNFSGHRYSKADLQATLSNPERECFLIDAEDRYGKYGYIGFAAIYPTAIPRIVDLAFSCRIQSKRVEHAVIAFLMRSYATRGAQDLEIFYHASEKNQQIAQVFSDLGCVEVWHNGNDFIYQRGVTGELPDTSVITVTWDDGGRSLQPLPVAQPLALGGSA